jgi:hypothetical protein
MVDARVCSEDFGFLTGVIWRLSRDPAQEKCIHCQSGHVVQAWPGSRLRGNYRTSGRQN